MRYPGVLAGSVILLTAFSVAAVEPTATSAVAAPPRSVSGGTVWLCRPGQHPDPCTASLETTVIQPDGARHIVDPADPKSPTIDCFYLYPNVSHQTTANANLRVEPQETAIAELEASPFSQDCRVFAPMYRESTGRATGDADDKAFLVAYQSAVSAWHEYLADYNEGRGVVLIGHSEGSGILAQLVAKQIDPSSEERPLFISAILTGLDFPVTTVGNLVPCRSVVQLGCLVDYNAYSGQLPSDPRFGRLAPVNGKRFADVCTNPANLEGGGGVLDSMYRIDLATQDVAGSSTEGILAPPIPDVSTPWVEFAGQYSGSCANTAGLHVLEVHGRGRAPELRAFPATFGLHVDDPNLAMGNLIRLVHSQASAYLALRRESSGQPAA